MKYNNVNYKLQYTESECLPTGIYNLFKYYKKRVSMKSIKKAINWSAYGIDDNVAINKYMKLHFNYTYKKPVSFKTVIKHLDKGLPVKFAYYLNTDKQNTEIGHVVLLLKHDSNSIAVINADKHGISILTKSDFKNMFKKTESFPDAFLIKGIKI